ncbi:MAG: putative DNA modification/repair radical SAM protein [Acidobacteriaceae bacterium]
MDVQRKLEILADAAKYDASCASSGVKRGGTGKGIGHSDGTGICHSYTPDGRCVSLLKILLTNYCTYDCAFCVNRASSDIQRARFLPEEVVTLTLDFYRRNYIEGLFLSSGIIQSPDYTMEQMVQVARSLREEHGFGGYIHLKAIPGAAQALLDQAGTWADRLSANIELPTQTDLVQLAPDKNADVIQSAMLQIHQRKSELEEDRQRKLSAPRFAPAGQSTQMIVGATPSTDQQILGTASHLYNSYKLRRIYYSGFSPYPKADGRLPLKPAPLVREHRLYQADWLMRYYGFGAHELTTANEPNLDLVQDPKLTWALRHRDFYPVDVNLGTREALLRVPGIGHRNVQRILKIRRYHRLTLSDLRKLNVRVGHASNFITTIDHVPQGRRLDAPDLAVTIARPQQLEMFASATSAVTGEI